MNVILGQFAVNEISPMALVMFRWLTVLILLGIFFKKTIIGDFANLRSKLVYILAMGGLGYTGFNSLFYLAAHSTSAINIGILQGAIPVFIVIGGYMVFQNKVTLLQIFGIIITCIGVLIVGSQGSLQNLTNLVFKFGDLIMVLACTLYAGYALGLKLRPQSSAISLFAGMAAAAFLASLPLLVLEISLGHFQWPTFRGFIVVGLVALFPSFLAQVFFMRGVELIGAARAGIFANLVPIFGAIFAVIFLQEEFANFHALALGLVLLGIWISERSK